MSRRPAAIVAILAGAVALDLAAYVFVSDFPRGLSRPQRTIMVVMYTWG